MHGKHIEGVQHALSQSQGRSACTEAPTSGACYCEANCTEHAEATWLISTTNSGYLHNQATASTCKSWTQPRTELYTLLMPLLDDPHSETDTASDVTLLCCAMASASRSWLCHVWMCTAVHHYSQILVRNRRMRGKRVQHRACTAPILPIPLCVNARMKWQSRLMFGGVEKHLGLL